MDFGGAGRETAGGTYPSRGDGWEDAVRVETLTTQAPSNAVKAESLSVFLGGRCLLAGTDMTVAERSRLAEVAAADGSRSRTVRRGTCYGLVGPNGCGKSTLLRLIADGHILTPPSWQVMLVGQHLPPCTGRTPVEEVLSADCRRAGLLEEQRLLQDSLVEAGEADASAADELLQASQRLTEIEQQLDRWVGAEDDVTRILLALGFRRHADCKEGEASAPSLAASMQHLSGGWCMKVQLAKALWLKPKLLLLDEPTNHLDFEALQWLEDQLDEYPHTTMVVSHDVSFLHAVCREIFWIKDRKLESMPRDVLSQEDLARMQRTKPLNFRFAIPDDGPPQDHGVSLHQAEFSYPSDASSSRTSSKALRVGGHVRFSGQSRAVMLGRNGSGKSTFLALCAGKIQPSRGSVDRTHGCQIGHYDQQMDEIDRCSELTAVEYLIQQCREPLEARLEVKARAAERSAARRGGKAAASALQKRLTEVARGVLSGFGFEGDLAVAVPVGRLSGGQKARLKLAVLSLRPAHILFLDEPTNHLDAEACEALAEGLSEFKGGIVVVTHDDLLIYRLIQCNWARSELLTCQAGRVRCQKEFGGQCLKSLKDQVRRSEATGSCDKELDPPSPKFHAEPAAKVPGSGPAKLPPWLASQRTGPRAARCGRETAPATKEGDGAVLDTEVSLQVLSSTSVLQSPARRCGIVRQERVSENGNVLQKVQGAEKEQVPRERVQFARSLPSALSLRPAGILDDPSSGPAVQQHAALGLSASLPNVPDRWDDDDADSDGCAGSEGIGGAATMQQDAGHALSIKAQPVLEEIVLPAPDTCSQKGLPCDLQDRHRCLVKAGSTHSRLRKDLVNLNKGVAKWLAKEKEGLLTHDDVVQRICNSAAARSLASAHGEEFREAEFVQDAIARGETASRRTAS